MMTENLSPLQLLKSRVSKISFRINDTFDSENNPPGGILNLNFEARAEHDFSNTEFTESLVGLKIHNYNDCENFPIEFELRYEGVFRSYFDKDAVDSSELEKIIEINSYSILYSMARELFTLMSLRTAGQNLSLPTVNPKAVFGNMDKSPAPKKKAKKKRVVKKRTTKKKILKKK